jgi:hypothetical protein|tara:strand:- start:111 stop:320 length:210 start_codon:yes stop_codon:yes gene_type:complete
MSETTITFKDKEYEIESLSDKAKYIIKQIQDLNQQAMQYRAKTDQVEVAGKAFAEMLTLELETETDEPI